MGEILNHETAMDGLWSVPFFLLVLLLLRVTVFSFPPVSVRSKNPISLSFPKYLECLQKYPILFIIPSRTIKVHVSDSISSQKNTFLFLKLKTNWAPHSSFSSCRNLIKIGEKSLFYVAIFKDIIGVYTHSTEGIEKVYNVIFPFGLQMVPQHT